MTGQMSFFEIAPEIFDPPEWPHCFKSCRHFESHPEYPPDHFPGTKEKRCRYCDHKHGTSGEQFWLRTINNIDRMFCIHYEE